MHKLEQFRPGLLFRRIHVLISLHDVDIDRELLPMRGERNIPFGNLGISAWSQMPDGRRVFDQKCEVVLFEQRQHPRRVGPNQIAHPRVELVVDMGENDIELRLPAPHGFHFRQPIRLQVSRQFRPVVEKGPRHGLVLCFEKLDRIESMHGLEPAPYIVIHGRETGRIRHAFERLVV